MKVARTYALLPLALAGALAVSACGTNDNSSGSNSNTSAAAASGKCTKLSGAGSSFQDPMEQQWAKDFPGTCKGAQINYQAVGSGAGIQQFGQGTIDYAGSDSLMKSDEQAAADKRCGSQAIHVPISAGGVGVTWNLPGVTDLQLSPDTLAGIFQGQIKTWDDAQIKADNPGANLPSMPITVVYRSDSSGTTSVFTSYLTAASTKWKLGGDKTVNWPVGQGAEKNQGVSAAVAQTPGGITYTEQAFATQHQLPLGKIKSAAGAYVPLDTDSVTAGVADAKFTGSGSNLTYQSNFTTTKSGAYPISSYTYAIVCTTYPSSFGSAKVDTLKKFLAYAVTTGQQSAPQLGFSPLPSDVASKVQQAVSALK